MEPQDYTQKIMDEVAELEFKTIGLKRQIREIETQHLRQFGLMVIDFFYTKPEAMLFFYKRSNEATATQKIFRVDESFIREMAQQAHNEYLTIAEVASTNETNIFNPNALKQLQTFDFQQLQNAVSDPNYSANIFDALLSESDVLEDTLRSHDMEQVLDFAKIPNQFFWLSRNTKQKSAQKNGETEIPGLYTKKDLSSLLDGLKLNADELISIYETTTLKATHTPTKPRRKSL